MTNEIISTVLGVIMPPLVDLVRTKLGVANSKWVYVIALASSLVLSAASSYLTGLWDGSADGLITNFAIIFATSQTIYNLYWAGTDTHKEMKEAVRTAN